MQQIDVIVACEVSNGIGSHGGIPWNIKEDMAQFKSVTTNAAPGKINGVIMGLNTRKGIPDKFFPLAGRINVVVSTTLAQNENFFVARTFEEAVDYLRKQPNVDKIFAIGGSKIYAEAVGREDCGKIYFTKILEPPYVCDTYFPHIDESKFKVTTQSEIKRDGANKYQFLIYDRNCN